MSWQKVPGKFLIYSNQRDTFFYHKYSSALNVNTFFYKFVFFQIFSFKIQQMTVFSRIAETSHIVLTDFTHCYFYWRLWTRYFSNHDYANLIGNWINIRMWSIYLIAGRPQVGGRSVGSKIPSATLQN